MASKAAQKGSARTQKGMLPATRPHIPANLSTESDGQMKADSDRITKFTIQKPLRKD